MMNDSISRRHFVHAAAATAGLAVASGTATRAADGSKKKWIKKAVKLGMEKLILPQAGHLYYELHKDR